MCARSKATAVRKCSENYITIESGTGKATPTSVAIYPIFDDKEVIAVLELAKFEEFTATELQLLEQISQFIGTSLSEILNHMKIEELLTESQALTEELQTQSEELQQQQEELKKINEKLHEQNSQYVEKTEELEKIKLDLEERNRGIRLASQYKTEFLANMSHELRTPLNSMLVLAQMLAENCDHNLTEKQISYANTIYSSGQDLLFLITDILDLSKIESGKLSIYPEEVFVSDLKEFVIDQFTPISLKKGIHFSVKISDAAPTIIYTDEQRIKQILKNLLSNAFKFTDKGEVTLMIVEDKGESDSKVKFIVKDTGIGINAAKLEYIFDEFYQADGTTTRKYGGTGLGLPISQNLSRLLGGTINAESIEGEGSIFTLHLPDYTIGSLDELNEVSATLLKKVEPTSQEKSEPTVLEEDTLFKTNNQETGIDHLKSKNSINRW